MEMYIPRTTGRYRLYMSGLQPRHSSQRCNRQAHLGDCNHLPSRKQRCSHWTGPAMNAKGLMNTTLHQRPCPKTRPETRFAQSGSIEDIFSDGGGKRSFANSHPDTRMYMIKRRSSQYTTEVLGTFGSGPEVYCLSATFCVEKKAEHPTSGLFNPANC